MTIADRCKQKAAEIEARIKQLHSRKCQTWETWTEKNVPLMEGGRADVTFTGCRKCGVAMAE